MSCPIRPNAIRGTTRDTKQSARALAELPASHREALGLAYDGGLPYSETAARTGEPLGTTKFRIAQGLMKLGAVSAKFEG